MSNLLIVGAQWGDEGKGKVVDLLASQFDVIARYQGGHNAGHTVEIGGTQFILQLVPSGILRPDKIAVIGNGVRRRPRSLVERDRHARIKRRLRPRPSDDQQSCPPDFSLSEDGLRGEVRELRLAQDRHHGFVVLVRPTRTRWVAAESVPQRFWDEHHFRCRLESAAQEKQAVLRACGSVQRSDVPELIEEYVELCDRLEPYDKNRHGRLSEPCNGQGQARAT